MTLRTITYDTATHKLVPREAEEIQIQAGCLSQTIGKFASYEEWWDAHSSGVSRRIRNLIAKDYRAMIEAAPEYCDKSLYQEPEINLESQDFYEVMQAYRHDQGTGHESFEAVKQWLRNPVYMYQDIGKDE